MIFGIDLEFFINIIHCKNVVYPEKILLCMHIIIQNYFIFIYIRQKFKKSFFFPKKVLFYLT